MNKLTKTLAAMLTFIPLVTSGTAHAQDTHTGDTPYVDVKHLNVPDEYDDAGNPFTEIYRDTIESIVKGEVEVRRDSILDPMRVVTNRFGKNWFVFATAGAHTFQGDYSSTSKFSGTISPDWGVGIGKWFTPGIALKLEFIKSKSEGYTEYLTGHYGYGPIKLNGKGEPFRAMSTSWWDISGSVVLNFTRLFLGYEGYNSPKRMNQIMGALGFGGVHHLGFEHGHGSDNEWAAHMELQYSRFFTRAKRFSLDFKIRALFYQTNFDLEYGLYDQASNKWDSNIGLDLGFTWYMGKKRANGWDSAVTTLYQRDFRQQDVLVYRERTRDVTTGVPRDYKLKTFTFYVFYPNNYSGRNDAPLVPSSNVNAIDYLAGGIFTQKKYNDSPVITNILNNGGRTTKQQYSDIPTEPANQDFAIDCVQRGYEMDTTTPLSLSMQKHPMTTFYDQAGYYYAPIWDGQHEWHYRIDDATLGQQLLSSSNYYEQQTYGLNAHSGLELIRQNLETEEGDYLVSFADVYAALSTNEGHISKYADEETVNIIRDIFKNGIVRIIEAHGVATSQDNYTGQSATQVGLERNNNLASCRANTVSKWLKGNKEFADTKSLLYVDRAFTTSAINRVTDPSTRGLAAKLNRCVKVRIQVIY